MSGVAPASPLNELVPLPFAARMVYLLTRGSLPPAHHLTDRLNGLAYALAARTTLYALDGAVSRPFLPEELAAGYFRNGAEEFRFIDSGHSITQIGVTKSGVATAIEALLGPRRGAGRKSA